MKGSQLVFNFHYLMQCTNCASQEFDMLANGAGRCRYCGQIIPGMYQPAPSGIERQFNNLGDNLTKGRKDKWIAILLAFFVGILGIQFFYLGETQKGVICLLITFLLGLVFGLGLIITSIWSLIFIVQLLTMNEQVFDAKYNDTKTMQQFHR